MRRSFSRVISFLFLVISVTLFFVAWERYAAAKTEAADRQEMGDTVLRELRHSGVPYESKGLKVPIPVISKYALFFGGLFGLIGSGLFVKSVHSVRTVGDSDKSKSRPF